MKAFNQAILYQCLFGELKGVSLTKANSDRLAEFIQLYDERQIDSPTVKYYFEGAVSKGVGAPSEITKKLLLNPNEVAYGAIEKKCAEYVDDYYIFFHPNFLNHIKYAMVCDSSTEKFCDTFISYYKNSSRDGKWLDYVLTKSLHKEKNYFGNTEAYKKIFKIIKTEVDNNETVKHCRKKIKEYWDSVEGPSKEPNVSNGSYDSKSSSSQSSNVKIAAYNYFNKIHRLGRFEKYWPKDSDDTNHYISGIDVSLSASGSESVSFEEVLFPSSTVPEEEKSSICLCGKGGIGKTFMILRAMETIFTEDKYDRITPFYIALQKANSNYNGNVFEALLKEIISYCGLECITKKEFDIFLHENGNKTIIFADGMNEVVGDKERSNLATSLSDMVRKYGCRICVSSRQNHVNMFNRLSSTSNFKEAEVNMLDEKQIDKYLKESNCIAEYSNIKSETQKLLKTPQGLAMYSKLVGQDNKKVNSFTSLGELIFAYIDLLLDINRDEIDDSSVLDFEKTLEEIAYSWVKNALFKAEISKKQIEALKVRPNIKDIFTLIDGNTYEFTHQNFRDVYCARYFARQISKIDEENIQHIFNEYFNLSDSLVSNNDEILELTSSFVTGNLKEYDKDAIDSLRTVANREESPLTNYDYPLSVLIRIHAFRNDNNISDLDLSNLDLREVSLSGYQLYSSDKSKYTIFDGAKINTSTFLKNGLDSASSVIAKYEYKDKLYVVAFAKTSIAVIDVIENQIEVARNLPSNDWINCCYVTEKNGEPIIYLGNKNGTVSEFYPHMFSINQRYVKQDLPIQNVGEIFSIQGIIIDNEEYIVFSSIKDGAGLLSAHKKYQIGENKFMQLRVPSPFELEKYKLEYINCKMSYSKKAKLIFVSLIDRIYVLNSDKLFNRSFAELQLYTDSGFNTPYISEHITCTNDQNMQVTNIKDIFVCDFDIFEQDDDDDENNDCIIVRLFINTGDKIDLFELEENKKEKSVYKAQLLHTYNPAGIENPEYTKFSEISIPHDKYKDYNTRVLVGIKAKNNYSLISRFYELYCSDNLNSKVEAAVVNVGNKYNGYATYNGVYYQLDKYRFLSTVSDYRSIDVDCVNYEDYPRQSFFGAYNGVHFIDITSDKFICGNYDGSIVEVQKVSKRRNTSKFNFKVCNTFQLHRGWVWKSVYLDDEGNYLVSCAYDGKFILLHKDGNSFQKTYVINVKEKLLDFCINGDMIYVVSNSGTLYEIRILKNDIDEISCVLQDAKPIVDDISNINLRAITIDKNDDKPLVFYNRGEDTLGHIIKFGSHNDFIDLNTKEFVTEITKDGSTKNEYVFIRQMQFVELSQYQENLRCLIAVGDFNEQGIVLIGEYGYDTNGDLDYSKMNVNTLKKVDGKINAFTVTQYDDDYILWLAHKDSKVSAYILTYEDGKVKIHNFLEHDKLKQSTSSRDENSPTEYNEYEEETPVINTDDQPMCMQKCGEKVLIGLLNGDVWKGFLNYNKDVFTKELGGRGRTVIELTHIIHTHADLESISKVTLRNCQIEDPSGFKNQLSSYFNILKERK